MTADERTSPRDRVRFTDAATVGAYRLGSLAARLTPGPLAAAAASSLGLSASFASPARREMFQRHLRRVNPRMGRAAMRVATQTAFDSYARYYVESFRLPTLSKATVERGSRRRGTASTSCRHSSGATG
ncbi:MAG: hypothetical protein R2713_14405 [Ilumatobacteraceae bacterium]